MSGYSPAPDDPPVEDDRPQDAQSNPTTDLDAYSEPAAVAASLLRVAGVTRIIDGLARGMTDDAIARSLGISSRTLNRRMTLIMDAVGARSRFQLGVHLTPELRAVLHEMTPDEVDAERPASPDESSTRPLRSAERLRRQLERRGRPIQAVMWLWLDPDEPRE